MSNFIKTTKNPPLLLKKELEKDINGKKLWLEGEGKGDFFIEESIAQYIDSITIESIKYNLYVSTLSDLGDTEIKIYKYEKNGKYIRIEFEKEISDSMSIEDYVKIEKNVFFKENIIIFKINKKEKKIVINLEEQLKEIEIEEFKKFKYTLITSKYQKLMFFKAIVVSISIIIGIVVYTIFGLSDVYGTKEKVVLAEKKLIKVHKNIENKRYLLEGLIKENNK